MRLLASSEADRCPDFRFQRGCRRSSSREANSMQKLLESSVGPQRIEGRAQQDGRLESGFITLVQPAHGLVRIAESNIDQGDIGIEGGILILPVLQIFD